MYGERLIRKTQSEFYMFRNFIQTEDFVFYSIEFVHRYKQLVITTLIQLSHEIIEEECYSPEVSNRLFFDSTKCYFSGRDPLTCEVYNTMHYVRTSIEDRLRMHIAHLHLNEDSGIYIQVMVSGELNLTVVVCTEEKIYERHSLF